MTRYEKVHPNYHRSRQLISRFKIVTVLNANIWEWWGRKTILYSFPSQKCYPSAGCCKICQRKWPARSSNICQQKTDWDWISCANLGETSVNTITAGQQLLLIQLRSSFHLLSIGLQTLTSESIVPWRVSQWKFRSSRMETRLFQKVYIES